MKKSDLLILDKVLLQPWFLPSRIAVRIHELVPLVFYKKMRYFFDDYGCMVCGKDREYHSNGMCVDCHHRVIRRLARSVKRRSRFRPYRRLDHELLRQEKLARKLLSRFSVRKSPITRRRPHELWTHNPVYEALCPRMERSLREVDAGPKYA